MSKPTRSARSVAATKSALILSISPRVTSRGTLLSGKYGIGEAEQMSQAPSSSGRSMPSHISFVAPLRPEWPSCMQTFAAEFARMKSRMRFHALSCSSFHSPVQPRVMRASGETQVISVNTSAAPPMAREP
jgi:hypothetical protein